MMGEEFGDNGWEVSNKGSGLWVHSVARPTRQ